MESIDTGEGNDVWRGQTVSDWLGTESRSLLGDEASKPESKLRSKSSSG